MSGNEIAVDYILHMDLEERLESTCRHYSAFEFGEFETLTDMTWEVAFDSFLREGLAPFLGGRPASLQQVDLLHILAMVIHPQPLSASTATATSLIPETAAFLEDQRYWDRARQLMSNRHAHSFHVNYEHRLKIIKLMVHNLVVPSYDAESPMVNCPLFDGALSHLRASLHAFCMGAISMEDAHWARSAVISITVQSRMEVAMKEEWNFLINRMVDDRTQYPGCKCCPQMLRAKPFGFFDRQNDQNGDDSSFCPHASKGLHLADFLIQICQSRHHSAGGEFLSEAFSSLADAVEWQMHCWKKPSEAEEAEEATPDVIEEPPCMLASLLFASKTFFYFLLPMEEHRVEDDPENIVTRRDELISCSIQLVHHQDDVIASEAAELLAVAFAYASKQSMGSHAKELFSSLQKMLPSVCNDSKKNGYSSPSFQSSIQNIISAASRMSPAFATSILNLLLEYAGKTSEKPRSPQQEHFLLRVIASVAVSNPGVGEGKASLLVDLLGKLTRKSSQSQGIAALLACRQAYFFERKEGGVEPGILETTQLIEDRWTLYKLGRLALQTGNYATARLCYQRILQSGLSERYFLWVSALSKITDSELCLSRYAARGLPQATIGLRSALSIFQSMKAVYLTQGSEFSFQISLITLRLDFLDLLTGLRQIIREMRLTGSGPVKRTRSFLHFQNIVRCFDALSRRYAALFRKHGLFMSQQSRTTLKALHALCRFVARSIRLVFSDMLPPQKKEESWPGSGFSGDSSLPVARFMRCLDERLLQKMSPAVDPVIRAAAMIEVVDGVLLCPSPFPIDFLSVAALPQGKIQLSADPDESCDYGDDADADEPRLDLAVVEGYPGISFDFCATGEIPVEFLDKSKLPFSTILLWHRAEFAGPLQEEDEAGPEEKQEDEHMADEKQEDEVAPAATVTVPRPWGFKAVSTNLQPNGKFNFRVECPPIREEGNYHIIVKLGCRDIRGGEWEIPVEGGFTRIQVQVSRSNS